MTLPALIAKYKEKQTVTAVKKFYSVLSQAINIDEFENPGNYNTEHIISLLNVLKVCAPGDKSCAPMAYKIFGGNDCTTFGINDAFQTYYYAQLVDGMIIRYKTLSEDCSEIRGTTKPLQNFCGEFAVDINGNKLPNRIGHDVFYFLVTKYGVIPNGVAEINTNNHKFDISCNNLYSHNTGYGCAAWIIVNGNMEYLHCNDLSLTGKNSCK